MNINTPVFYFTSAQQNTGVLIFIFLRSHVHHCNTILKFWLTEMFMTRFIPSPLLSLNTKCPPAKQYFEKVGCISGGQLGVEQMDCFRQEADTGV